MNQRSEKRNRFSKDFIMEMVEILQKMRREHLVDFQIFYVIMWIRVRLGEHKKNVFEREDYIIRRAFKG